MADRGRKALPVDNRLCNDKCVSAPTTPSLTPWHTQSPSQLHARGARTFPRVSARVLIDAYHARHPWGQDCTTNKSAKLGSEVTSAFCC